jgi:hypothetical protein
MANTTWNASDKTANVTLTGSNLIATATGFNGGVRAVDGHAISGKYYWEYTINTITSAQSGVGISLPGESLVGGITGTTARQVVVNNTGQVYRISVAQVALGSLTAGTVVCIALDIGSNLLWFRFGAAGNWNANASNNPATGVGGVALFGSNVAYRPYTCFGSTSDQTTANFGDIAFTGAVPSGYTAGFPTPSSPTYEAATQIAVEEWASIIPPQFQATQVAVEQWAAVSAVAGGTRMLATQMGVEMWASAAAAAAVQQTRAVILA